MRGETKVTFNGIIVSNRISEQLDLFFVRREKRFSMSIEPQHLMLMEFLAACSFTKGSISCWGDLLKLSHGRKRTILQMISGLLRVVFFINDFMDVVMYTDLNVVTMLYQFYNWLFQADVSTHVGRQFNHNSNIIHHRKQLRNYSNTIHTFNNMFDDVSLDIDFSEKLKVPLKYELQSMHWTGVEIIIHSGILKDRVVRRNTTCIYPMI